MSTEHTGELESASALDSHQFTRPQDFHHPEAPRFGSDSAPIALTRFGALRLWATMFGALAVISLGMHIVMESLVVVTGDVTIPSSLSGVGAFAAGMLATVLFQSSTMVSVLIVTSVGTGVLPVAVALPAIFGANLATTATPLLAAWACARNKERYQRILNVASLHFWFNAFGIAVFLPMEVLFHPLQSIAERLTEPVSSVTRFTPSQLWSKLTFLEHWGAPYAVLAAVLGVIIVCCGMNFLVAQTRRLVTGTGFAILERSGGLGDGAGIAGGAFAAMATGASSIAVMATSAIAGAQTLDQRPGISSRNALPLILGANIGTTLSSIMVALSAMGPAGLVSLQVALVHFLFNLTGTFLVLIIPVLKPLIITSAQRTSTWLAHSTIRQISVFALVFLILPTALMWA